MREKWFKKVNFFLDELVSFIPPAVSRTNEKSDHGATAPEKVLGVHQRRVRVSHADPFDRLEVRPSAVGMEEVDPVGCRRHEHDLFAGPNLDRGHLHLVCFHACGTQGNT